MVTVATHNGSFHTDDVFAVAALQLLHGEEHMRVVRTRDQAVIAAADIVVDVGGVYDPERQLFDHHQRGAPVRENGIPYSAIGLLWRHYGTDIAGCEEVAMRLEERLVQPIDAGDTGVSLYDTLTHPPVRPVELYQITRSFAPPWGSGESKDQAFFDAVGWARGLLTRLIEHERAQLDLEQLVLKTYQAAEDPRVLVFDVPVSEHALIPYSDVMVVVSPREVAPESDWNATIVRVQPESFTPRAQFPETWRGLNREELAAAAGIPDAVFCHKAGHLFIARSRESALRAAREAQ